MERLAFRVGRVTASHVPPNHIDFSRTLLYLCYNHTINTYLNVDNEYTYYYNTYFMRPSG